MEHPTIMIVEDEVSLLENLKLYLTLHGCRVLPAHDVQEAKSFLASDKPDLILLDLLLPNAMGTVLLKYLQDKGCTIPTVVITNTDSVGRREECMKLGARDYIIKSNTSLSRILDMIHTHLA